MNDQEFVLVLVAMFFGFTLTGLVGYSFFSWLKSRSQRREPQDMHLLHEQIAQLQMSVDTMALEVERISEAQRFATKLLSERADAARIERGGAH